MSIKLKEKLRAYISNKEGRKENYYLHFICPHRYKWVDMSWRNKGMGYAQCVTCKWFTFTKSEKDCVIK